MRRSLLAGISLFATASISAPAWAEGDSTTTVATPEIVVTAQRREEKLSKVPVSVVAFGAETLNNRNITSEQDMESLVPGLQVKNGQNSNQLSFSMRGQTLDPFSGTSPAVLTYLNEAPYNPGNTATEFFDLSSVQVLKGPQGTLFGRNATGGAVLYSTQMPGDQFDGFLIARFAQRDYGQVQGALDLPLAPGLFVARIAFDITKGNGYITNVNTGNTLGNKDNRAVRGTFVFTPSSSVKNVTIVQYSAARGTEGEGNLWDYNSAPTPGGGPASQFTSNGITHIPNTSGGYLTDTLAAVYGNNNGPAAPGFFPGAVEGYAAWSRANPYKIFLQYDLPHIGNNTFVSNETTVDLGSDTKVKNLFSYMQGYAVTPGNLAGGPFGALWLFNEPNNPSGLSGTPPGGEVFHSTTFSDEVQLQGKLDGGRLEYTAGAFYSSQIRHEIIPILIGNDLGLPAPLADIDYAYRNTEQSKAIYAQATYKFTDQLSATAGGRYTWESVGISQDPGSVFTLGGPIPGEHKDLSAPAWTANVQYQADPHSMFYFSQRGSFRSGNFNGTVSPATSPLTGLPENYFTNEYVHDFELGYKFNGRIAEVPVQFNIAAYDVIVKHAQHALYAIVDGAPAGFTVNVPESVTKGIEVDANVGVTTWLDLNVNFAYTDAKYTDGLVPIPGGSPVTVDSYPDSPRVSGSAGADFKFPVPETLGKVDLRADYYGQTHTFFSSTNGTVTPGTELSGYSTVALRLNWKEIEGSRVSAAVYVRNVANKLYYISGYALGNSSGLNTAYPGEPRTVGGEISVKF